MVHQVPKVRGGLVAAVDRELVVGVRCLGPGPPVDVGSDPDRLDVPQPREVVAVGRDDHLQRPVGPPLPELRAPLEREEGVARELLPLLSLLLVRARAVERARRRRALRDVYYRGNGRERRERRPEAPRGRFTLLMAAPPSQFAEGSHVTSCTPTGRVQTNWVGIGFWAALRSAAPHRSAVNRSQPQQFQFKLAIANKSLQARPRRLA